MESLTEANKHLQAELAQLKSQAKNTSYELAREKRALKEQIEKLTGCPSMTILENMSMADNKGKPFNLLPCVNRKKTDEYRAMLSQLGLGLEDKMGVRVGNLSGGQRQAMALLMSTMTPIEFLILDEHTAALDPKTAEIIMQLTGKIVREKQLTTIMVTHNLRYAVEYGDRLLMMHQGHAELDVSGKARENLKVEDLLDKFNAISIECGN